MRNIFLSEIHFTSSPRGVHSASFSKGRTADDSAGAKRGAELHLKNINPKTPWMEEAVLQQTHPIKSLASFRVDELRLSCGREPSSMGEREDPITIPCS